MQNNNIREVEMLVEYKRGSFYSHTNILVTISSSGEENKKKTTWQFNSVLLKIEYALRVSGLSLKWKKWAPTHSLTEQFQKCLWQKSLVLPPPISYVNEIGRAHFIWLMRRQCQAAMMAGKVPLPVRALCEWPALSSSAFHSGFLTHPGSKSLIHRIPPEGCR